MDSPEREAKMDNLELPKKKSWDGAIAMTRQLVSGIVESSQSTELFKTVG